MEFENVLAIDIGGTSVKIGVVKGEEILENTSIRNIFKGKCETLLPGIKEICKNYISKYNIHKIGIGCPGEINDGVVMWASNLGWHNFPLLNEFQKEFKNCQIILDNDGYTACQAEIKFGSLYNVQNGLFVTFGRGVGGAIIVDNKIMHGAHNKGGNFGHMVTHTNGRKCNCGRRGCFETYTSVLGLIQTVKEINMRWQNENDQIDTSDLSGFKIVSLSKEKNPIILEAVYKWNQDIAEGLLDLCLIFDPQIIVLAGGITDSGLINLDYIKSTLAKQEYYCEVKLAKFTGKTGLVGAAALHV